MVNEAIAELLGNLALKLFDLGVDKFNDFPGFDIDQVIVVGFGNRLITLAAIAEIVAIKDAGLFEETHGAVDGCDRDARIDGRRAAVKQLDIGVIIAF